MGIYTAVMNIVQGSVIAPLVYGRAVSLHPAVVLVAIPAGGTLAGVLGMFLAVPILGIAAGVWRHLLAAMGSEDPATRARRRDGRGTGGRGSAVPGARPRPRARDMKRAGRRRPARRAVRLGPLAAHAGCGFGSATGCPGPMIVGAPRSSSFGGRSLNRASKPSCVHGLLGDQLLGQAVEPVAVRRQDLGRPHVGPVDDRPDLLVDRLARPRPSSCAARRSPGRGTRARRASRTRAGRAGRSCRTRSPSGARGRSPSRCRCWRPSSCHRRPGARRRCRRAGRRSCPRTRTCTAGSGPPVGRAIV